MKLEWIRVRRSMPCPVCEKPNWCSVSADGSVAICMRVQGDRSSKSGGWIHRLGSGKVAIADYLVQTAKKTDANRLSPKEVSELALSMYSHSKAEAKRAEVASALGVYIWALDRLKVGYGKDRRGEFASFPSRNEHGHVVGITRRYADGTKMTYPGTSNSGVFYDDKWCDNDGPLFIVEGGSDVAACVSECVCAIGRPSNIGGAEIIAKMIRAASWRREVIVVGERDSKPEKRGVANGCPKNCIGCPQCYPGLYGAKTVAIQLTKAGIDALVRLPPVGSKDVRDLFNKEDLQDWAS